MRKDLIDKIDFAIAILDTKNCQKKDVVNKARIFLKNSVKTDAEFSATAIDYLSTFNIS